MLSSKLRYGNKHTKNCNDFSKIIFLSYTKIWSQKQFLAEHMNDKSAQLGLSQYSLSLSLSLFLIWWDIVPFFMVKIRLLKSAFQPENLERTIRW